ncbi:hypothetical protein KAR91_32475 [Candidatus Pacearchaeota archaeon]|nr:hypothetical protein [Candidatus Pacearchaeota archaeon]
MKIHEFEIACSVLDYLEDEMNRNEAFELATSDEDGAKTIAELEMFEAGVTNEVTKMVEKPTVEFLECDSGNINHAAAYWNVTVKGPEAQIAVIAMAMEILYL